MVRTRARFYDWTRQPVPGSMPDFSELMRQAPSPAYPRSHRNRAPCASRHDPDYTPEPASSPRRSRRTTRRESRSHSPTRRNVTQHTAQLDNLPRADIVVRNVAILGVVLAVGLLFLNFALYAAIFAVGVLGPAWQTFKSLESRNSQAAPVIIEVLDEEDDSLEEMPNFANAQSSGETAVCNWQAYWIMAALLFSLHGLILRPFLMRMLPNCLYHAMMLSAITWLTRHRGANAAYLYAAVVRPAFRKSEYAVDQAVTAALTNIDHVTRHAIISMNNAVAPIAKQLEHAAAATRHQLQQQAQHNTRRGLRRR